MVFDLFFVSYSQIGLLLYRHIKLILCTSQKFLRRRSYNKIENRFRNRVRTACYLNHERASECLIEERNLKFYCGENFSLVQSTSTTMR